jgi:uncharacterized protein (DUF983 family)
MTQHTQQDFERPAPERDWRSAARRGWSQRCPHCGEGAMFRAYLKVIARDPGGVSRAVNPAR